jgi:hypothetical protein
MNTFSYSCNKFCIAVVLKYFQFAVHWKIYKHFLDHFVYKIKNIVARTATIQDGYWIYNWIYWITNSYTQLQCIHFITRNNWVPSLPLKTPDPALQPLLQPTLMASLAITSHNWLGTVRSSKQASSSLLLAFASMVILGVEPHRDPRQLGNVPPLR